MLEPERKIHPITGHHTTFYSMAAEGLADERAVGGIIIYFEKDGTMHTGDVKITLAQLCMAHGYVGMLVNQMMEKP